MKSLREQAQEHHTPAWGAVDPYASPLLTTLGAMLKGWRICPRCDATGRDPDNSDLDCAACDGARMVREEPTT